MSVRLSSALTVVGAVALATSLNACKPAEAEDLRPSLTMFRTGEVVQEDYEEEVVVPEDKYIPGIVIKSEDDEFEGETGRRVANQDAASKTDLSAATVLADPKALDEHASDAAYAFATVDGDLFDTKPGEGLLEYTDVEQGAIGDCYMVAATSAVLFADKENFVRDGLIREIKNNKGQVTHFVVRLYDAWGAPQDIPLDADLLRKNGRLTYARSTDSSATGEEWGIALLEKAYAQWHKGYQKIGDGGWTGDVMQAFTGATATNRIIKRSSDKTLVDGIKDAVADGRPVAAGTYGEKDGVDYAGTGVHAYHAYSVHGIVEKDGKTYVTLRNPWAEDEPAGNGPNDGIFDMELADFKRLYEDITFGGDYSKDTKAPDAVKDLALGATAGTLTFKATGDDGKKGLAHRYDVRWSTAAITVDNFYKATVIPMGDPQSPGSVETVDLSTVSGDGTKYVAVRVEDESGNISQLSNVVSFGATPTNPGTGTGRSFGFETGAEGFTASGLWHRTDEMASTGTWSFWFGQDATYDYDTGTRAQGTLTSPTIDLTGLNKPKLSWENLLDVESGSDYDKAWVEVATSGSSTWKTVWDKKTIEQDFTLETVDLSAYKGKKIVVRFRFDSVDGSDNEGLGWFVDALTFSD